MTDAVVVFGPNGTTFDLALDGAGDLSHEGGLRTAVLVSLFSDRRAADDDAIPDGTGYRRGWWADAYNDRPAGSRLWLLAREKQLPDVLARAKGYAEEALEWLREDGVATAVEVGAEWVARGVMALRVRITLADATHFDDVFEYRLEAA